MSHQSGVEDPCWYPDKFQLNNQLPVPMTVTPSVTGNLNFPFCEVFTLPCSTYSKFYVHTLFPACRHMRDWYWSMISTQLFLACPKSWNKRIYPLSPLSLVTVAMVTKLIFNDWTKYNLLQWTHEIQLDCHRKYTGFTSILQCLASIVKALAEKNSEMPLDYEIPRTCLIMHQLKFSARRKVKGGFVRLWTLRWLFDVTLPGIGGQMGGLRVSRLLRMLVNTLCLFKGF